MGMEGIPDRKSKILLAREIKKAPDKSEALASGDGGNRTPDTRIFSPLLYRLSYITILNCGGKDSNRIHYS